MEASDRLKQAQHFSTRRKVQMETLESIRTSLIPGEWVSSIDLSDTYLHFPFHPNSRKIRFCHRSQVFQFTSLPFDLATVSQVFTMVVKEVSPGDKGVETPPPNDSSKASLSPPVSGCLRSFRRDWQTNMFIQHVKPNLPRFPLIQSGSKALQKIKLWPLASSLFCQRMQKKGWKM